MTDIFRALELRTGHLVDASRDPYPGRFSAVCSGSMNLEGGATHLGFLRTGAAQLQGPAGPIPLAPGMYFSAPWATRLDVASGEALVMSRFGERGFFSVGGPVESTGRLRYIDGCTDSLLLPPVIAGDACLNLLHIPKQTAQSRHRHPSYRWGCILAGQGHCVTDTARIPLHPGLAFAIEAGGFHSFHTADEDLLVLAYHPDSDTGPTHEDHPMINRTLDLQA